MFQRRFTRIELCRIYNFISGDDLSRGENFISGDGLSRGEISISGGSLSRGEFAGVLSRKIRQLDY
nr:MAG TPA: hypothetical protein [Caudoviricetes sp.]